MKKVGCFCLRLIDRIAVWSGWIAAGLIPIMMVVMTFETIARYVFDNPTIWGFEMTMFLFGGIAMLGAGYTLHLREHVNVDIIYKYISPRARAIIDVITAPFCFIFCGVLLWTGAEMFWPALTMSHTTGTDWNPPAWPILLAMPAGAFIILLVALARFARDLIMAIRGREELQ